MCCTTHIHHVQALLISAAYSLKAPCAASGAHTKISMGANATNMASQHLRLGLSGESSTGHQVCESQVSFGIETFQSAKRATVITKLHTAVLKKQHKCPHKFLCFFMRQSYTHSVIKLIFSQIEITCFRYPLIKYLLSNL